MEWGTDRKKKERKEKIERRTKFCGKKSERIGSLEGKKENEWGKTKREYERKRKRDYERKRKNQIGNGGWNPGKRKGGP